MEIKKVDGGVTNQLQRFKITTDKVSRYVIRIYGMGKDEAMAMSRPLECNLIQQLGSKGFTKNNTFLFNNGRIEDFVDATLIDNADDMRKHSKAIAQMFAQQHSIPFQLADEFGALQTPGLPKVSSAADNGQIPMAFTLQLMRERFSVWMKSIEFYWDSPKLDNIRSRQSLDDQRGWIESNFSQLDKLSTDEKQGVIGHNDLLSGNILINTDGDPLFIDFEFAAVVPFQHDLANHLGEQMGFECNYELRPHLDEIKVFAGHYLEALE